MMLVDIGRVASGFNRAATDRECWFPDERRPVDTLAFWSVPEPAVCGRFCIQDR